MEMIIRERNIQLHSQTSPQTNLSPHFAIFLPSGSWILKFYKFIIVILICSRESLFCDQFPSLVPFSALPSILQNFFIIINSQPYYEAQQPDISMLAILLTEACHCLDGNSVHSYEKYLSGDTYPEEY